MKYLLLFITLFSSTFAVSKKDIVPFLENRNIDQQIPKIIHQIWVGKKQMHPECIKAMDTWKQKHPDWEYKLWTDEDIDSFDWTNKELFLSIQNPGAKSDVWRYEILNKYGGLYIDVDFVCLKPFDLFHENLSFYSSFLGDAHEYLCANGIFACTPNHPILIEVIKSLSSLSYQNNRITNNYILNTTGPFFFTNIIKKYAPQYKTPDTIENDLFIFPQEFFFPINNRLWRHLHKNGLKIPTHFEPLLEDAYAVHLFARSWVNPKTDRPM